MRGITDCGKCVCYGRTGYSYFSVCKNSCQNFQIWFNLINFANVMSDYYTTRSPFTSFICCFLFLIPYFLVYLLLFGLVLDIVFEIIQRNNLKARVTLFSSKHGFFFQLLLLSIWSHQHCGLVSVCSVMTDYL